MNIQTKAGTFADQRTDALVLPLFEGQDTAGSRVKAVDALTDGLLSDVLKAGDFKGKPNQVLVLQTPKGGIKRWVLVGLGKESDVTLEKLRNAAGKGSTAARDLGVKSLAVAVCGAQGIHSEATVAQAIAEGSLMSLYQMNEFRTKDREDLKNVTDVLFVGGPDADIKALEEGVKVAQVLNDSITLVRDLVVRPGNVVTATVLGQEAKKACEAVGIKVTLMGKSELEKMGFGGLLGVNLGSVEPPCFIVMEWNGGAKDEAPIAVVGKGVTFDTGGISIKPADNMDKMKYDMAGGAATIGILRAVAALKVKRNVVGLVPATDNMPSGSAVKPGDVLTTYSGQTVEVLNTDAEGRLVLCDALAYAVKDKKAQAIIDMATLTGACVVALGSEAIGVLGNHQELVDLVLEAGEHTGDRGWQLPLWKEYNELLRSDIADMKNIGGREAGTITAACYLARFVGETPWVHLDIAGTGWTEKEKPYRPKGPTAVPVRMVVELIRNWQELKNPKGSKF
jgi:leucyl aminopeptidase